MNRTKDRPPITPTPAPTGDRHLSPLRIVRTDFGVVVAEVEQADGALVRLPVGELQAKLLDVLIQAFEADSSAVVPTRHLGQTTGSKDPARLLHLMRDDHPELRAVIVAPGQKRRGGGWRLRRPAEAPACHL